MDSCSEDLCFLCLKGSIDYAYLCCLECNCCGRPSQVRHARSDLPGPVRFPERSRAACRVWRRSALPSLEEGTVPFPVLKLLNSLVQIE